MLKPFIQLYLQIMMLRKGPQDLPHSRALLALLITLVMCQSLLMVLLPDSKGQTPPFEQMVLFVLVYYGVQIGSVYLLLKALKYPARTTQTLCALLGVDILFGLLQLVIFLFLQYVAATSVIIMIFSYILLIWSLVVNATIFRHALAISFVVAGMLSFTFFLLSLYIQSLFGL